MTLGSPGEPWRVLERALESPGLYINRVRMTGLPRTPQGSRDCPLNRNGPNKFKFLILGSPMDMVLQDSLGLSRVPQPRAKTTVKREGFCTQTNVEKVEDAISVHFMWLNF